MSRTERLLNLVQVMRRHRNRITAQALAAELHVSVRTVYRDIQTLAELGFRITGEAGLGYILRPGSVLPPMSFSNEELDAIVLGLRWVVQRGDPLFSMAAKDARAKIQAVLPADQRATGEDIPFLSGPGPTLTAPPGITQALREERRLRLQYADAQGKQTRRVVWPIAIAFFESVQVLITWCENREDFRSFRMDRVIAAEVLERFPGRRRSLLAQWREREGVPEQI